MEGVPDRSLSLDIFLPLDRRRALAQGYELPERATGTALLADLSGFTPLMEHLRNTLGPQQGAEELTRLLNALFTPLIREVHGYGGSIVAFGGDALTCWFPGAGERVAPRAAACALAMQRHGAGLGRTETPAGPVRLAMHIGLASGPVRRFCVGQPPYGLCDVPAGATMDRMAEAQHRAGVGQVVVDTATAAHLPPEAYQPLDEGFALLSGRTIVAPPLPYDPLLPIPPLPHACIRRWLNETLCRRLEAGPGGFAAELRLVTSMFVHFSGLDYDGDPDAGRKLQRYVSLAQEHLAPYEGYLDLVACGDKGSLLFILFGAPVAHEDDPVRAVGFALEFQEVAHSLPFIRDQRIGISLGRVYAGILGSEQRCTYTVLGDEVNVSARLMQSAEAGQVLVSQWVQQAAAGHYAFDALGEVAVKGRAKAVPVFAVLSPRGSRPAERKAERLVGRESEQQTIAHLLTQVEVGRGQTLLLLGEAGVGKSALVREVLRQVRRRGWFHLVGTCLSYGRNIPYLPWRAIVEQACQVTPEMNPAERTARLAESVAHLPDPPERPGYWRARFPLLAEAMGLEVPETPLTRSLEGELRRDNTFQLLEALVQGTAAERPSAIVLEDAYWADELSLALATRIAAGVASLPLLLVVVHRPFTAATPAAVQAMRALPHCTRLELAPLEEESALALARQRLHGAALPTHLERLLREKAQGNPFFIEELLRALQEAGYLRRVDGAMEMTGAWESLELPDTIEGVVRARMDRLPEEERLTLKVSSVIGRTFQRLLLQEVHPARPAEPLLARQMERLDEADFTQLEEGPPEWRYAFRHPILHEVAYETLLFAQRRQLHGAIGAVLERWHGADLVSVLDLLAFHYAHSEEREKAIHYLHAAGDKARREYANEVALGHYNQALERLLPEEVARRYDLLAGRERIHDLLGNREAQAQDLEEMARLAVELGDSRRQVEVLNRQARRAVDMGDFQEARRLAMRGWQQAEKDHHLAEAAEAQRTLGILHGILGEYDEAARYIALSQESYRALGDLSGEASCLINLGLVHLYRGDAEQAREDYRRALERVRALGNRIQEAMALINLGLAESNLGEYEQARESLRQALTIAREIGSAAHEELALGGIGAREMLLGDLESAAAHHDQALQLARRLEDREGEAACLSNLGLVWAYQGDLEQSRRFLQEALDHYRDMGHRRGEALARHYFGVVELLDGKASTACEFLQQALKLRQEIGESGNILVTRAWLGWACLSSGRPDQARAHLEEVLAQLEREGYGGDEPEQEVWWAAYQVWQGCRDRPRARQSLERAHRLVQEQAGRIRDPALRRSFLTHVPVNREIVRAWEQSDRG